jgi:uncharacterized membrane protein
MHTLEPELRTLQAEGLVDGATAARLLAADRRDVFSVQPELRLAMYAGVLLVVGGVGMVLARNLDRIGPLAIALGLALAAIVCAVPALRAKLAGRPLNVTADYLLLLGALLASADLAYVETQFKLLGPLWSWHLLWLAVAHALLAYTFRSTLVLAASLTSLAGWFGAGSTIGDVVLSYTSPEVGTRALACAAVIAAWRNVDLRVRPASQFSGTFDHFAANLAFVGAVAWCVDWPWLAAGLPLLGGLAFVSIRHAFDTGREAFLVYGVLYAALGFCVAVVPHVNDFTAACALVLLVVCGSATAIWQMRRQLRDPVA